MVTELVAISNRINAPNGQYLGADLYIGTKALEKKRRSNFRRQIHNKPLIFAPHLNPNALHVQI